MIPPQTKYTQVGDSWIGYQVVGDGPIDLVYVTGLASNIDTMWDWPDYARILERMASYSRLILFDPRGSGVSDDADLVGVPTWEQWTQDLRAVLSAAGSERAAILAQFDGSPRAILFAATYPTRTEALIIWNGYARSTATEDYPIGLTPEGLDESIDLLAPLWGTTEMAGAADPSMASNPEYAVWAAKHLRATMTPGQYARTNRYISDLDVRVVLPTVQVPTLVLHRSELPFIPKEWGRYIADNIPGARFTEIPGHDLNIYGAHSETLLDHIEDFLGVVGGPSDSDRVLATVLFTDIVDSTGHAAAIGDRRWKERLEAHDRTARSQIERFHGRLVNRMGDGLLATFDGPGRAIRCAQALGRALEPSGIKIRSGLHTGEIELREGDDIGGIAVHIASRVMHEAGPGEVICSRTVKDLVAGSEFAFDDRGVCTLKGVPDQWQLYAVTAS